jgi:hypothetical protein
MSPKLVVPLSGTIFVVLLIVALLIGGKTPGVGDPAKEVVAFYVDKADEQQIAGGLFGLGSVALLFFVGVLHRRLRAAASDEGVLAMVVALGGVMIAVGLSIFAGIGFTLGDGADDLPAAATLTLNALNTDLFFPLLVGTATFNLSLALSILRYGGLPRPLGWLALVVAIACVTPAGYVAFLATGIVVVWSSVVLTLQSMSPEGAS